MAKTETAGAGRSLPRLLKLKEAAEQIGVTEVSLRREVRAGRLKCYRPRPSSNAPILLHPRDVLAWLDEHAGQRQRAVRAGA